MTRASTGPSGPLSVEVEAPQLWLSETPRRALRLLARPGEPAPRTNSEQ